MPTAEEHARLLALGAESSCGIIPAATAETSKRIIADGHRGDRRTKLVEDTIRSL